MNKDISLVVRQRWAEASEDTDNAFMNWCRVAELCSMCWARYSVELPNSPLVDEYKRLSDQALSRAIALLPDDPSFEISERSASVFSTVHERMSNVLRMIKQIRSRT